MSVQSFIDRAAGRVEAEPGRQAIDAVAAGRGGNPRFMGPFAGLQGGTVVGLLVDWCASQEFFPSRVAASLFDGRRGQFAVRPLAVGPSMLYYSCNMHA